VLGGGYEPIALNSVRGLIERSLASFSEADCRRVLRADAIEAKGGSEPRFFGVPTWRPKNFAIKLSRLREREARTGEPIPWKQMRGYLQKNLNDLVSETGKSEHELLVDHYSEFQKRFHKKKGTWQEVRPFWDTLEERWLLPEEHPT
jgi:hypothetical protein